MTCAFTGLVVMIVIVLGLWGPVVRILREGHAAETERLLDAFETPVAAAMGKGDDLARIDELHRLEKLPGVMSAQAEREAVHPSFTVRTLVWEGKNVGWLRLHVAPTRWRRLRYGVIERIWSLSVLMALAGSLIGMILQQRRKKFLTRLVRLSERRQKRHRSHLDASRKTLEDRLLPWTSQAMAFTSDGLILLDGRQGVVALNATAQELLHLPSPVVGRHWLDLQKTTAWASALQRSIDHPGKRIGAPVSGQISEISLLTLSPEATWIVLRPVSSHKNVSIV